MRDYRCTTLPDSQDTVRKTCETLCVGFRAACFVACCFVVGISMQQNSHWGPVSSRSPHKNCSPTPLHTDKHSSAMFTTPQDPKSSASRCPTPTSPLFSQVVTLSPLSFSFDQASSAATTTYDMLSSALEIADKAMKLEDVCCRVESRLSKRKYKQ